jgi:hypothetical protein
MTTSSRPWFRFGLRTLFVAITIMGALSGWAAYQLHWIRQRHAFLESRKGFWVPLAISGSTTPEPAAPRLLWLFGEKGIYYLAIEDKRLKTDGRGYEVLDMGTFRANFEEGQRLFPEAKIYD